MNEKLKIALVGDVHGCREELEQLLDLVWTRHGRGVRLVFLGDYIDRGPEPVESIRLIRSLDNTQAILGNHDSKAERWHRHEETRRATGKKNPMKPPAPERRAQWEALSSDDLAWIRSLPHQLEIPELNMVCVHGGLERKPLSEQRKDGVIRCRYLDPGTGEMLPINDDLSQPDGSVYWSEVWPGPQSVVYGHAVHSLSAPRIDRHQGDSVYGHIPPAHPDDGSWNRVIEEICFECGLRIEAPRHYGCFGIDTGAVFGGRLTALVVEHADQLASPSNPPEFIQVDARRTYAQRVGVNV